MHRRVRADEQRTEAYLLTSSALLAPTKPPDLLDQFSAMCAVTVLPRPEGKRGLLSRTKESVVLNEIRDVLATE